MNRETNLSSHFADDTSPKPGTLCVHVDAQKSRCCFLSDNVISARVEELVRQRGYPHILTNFAETVLAGQVDKVVTEYKDDDMKKLDSATLVVHVYEVNDDVGLEELEDGMAAASHWVLPSAHLEGLWESLIYESPIKDELLSYSSTALLFADKKVDPNVISWNKVVLLHGPPGTGKTSLCRALAQKLTIRMRSRFTHGQLLEINSHSLFSKWFSESGKLVMKLFQKIQSLIDDGSTLVFVLIDEVESLAHCRSTAIGGNEPSDAIRVVNALLTQIDIMKRYPNVFILTTSNISGVIDLAFVDRADFKYHLGYPSQKCISKIIMSCLKELYRVSVINENMSFLESNADEMGDELQSLYNSLCHRAVGLSGRRLRKLPFIAHSICTVDGTLTLKTFLLALSEAVDRQLQENKEITSCMEVR
ncbi:pachytene checkpoint protein 2 homolog isoform X1 [Rhipicephalus sanguineus]|uniref:pachytene checkpoint protein 2 homolog isoform X1 n=1 Tax=Rhipicephalus sanguineus TaxID=34632 RepID=UPI0018948B04|nr:pachytene checkpoint protein 2 homolog isoform X1 [Rhipicephalus sanguineus]